MDRVMITAKLNPAEKEKLKQSGYNSREAIEYFNSMVNNVKDRLDIDAFFLNKEINQLKEELLVREKRLEEINKQQELITQDDDTLLKTESYKKIIRMYRSDNTKSKKEFKDYINEGFIHNTILNEIISIDSTVEEYTTGLLSFYEDTIISNTN